VSVKEEERDLVPAVSVKEETPVGEVMVEVGTRSEVGT